MKTVTVRLPEPLAVWLSQRARELGWSKSDLVRDALERARNRRDGASRHDVLANMCGTVRGPRNLSTNRRHFAGFGK
jgi:Arc/MetJ-type ribon-helix-helix transcriptional regulator